MLARIMTSWDGGDIEPDPDGFVHLSWADQVEGTIRRHHPDAHDLTLLVIDEAALPPGALRFEPSGGGATYPHLYATLPAAAVVRAVPWQQGDPLPPRPLRLSLPAPDSPTA